MGPTMKEGRSAIATGFLNEALCHDLNQTFTDAKDGQLYYRLQVFTREKPTAWRPRKTQNHSKAVWGT